MKKILLLLLLLGTTAYAGGPLRIGSTSLGNDGQGLVWGTMPIRYTVDSGPLAVNPSGATIINNASGRTRVAAMFQSWASVPTANLSFTYDGAIRATTGFGGGDVRTAPEMDAVYGACTRGEQNPIIFDANGAMFTQLIGDPNVIGVTAICRISGGHIAGGLVALNGRFVDGVNAPPNYELTSDQFNETFTHEFGHFLGLDHSQINVNILSGSYPCDVNELAGLPLMFPYIACQARLQAGLPVIARDDAAWISKLYPKASFSTTYGKISGHIYFSDGQSGFQGVNIIARSTDAPRVIAFSGYSGQYFTGNPGQSVTGDNPGSTDGSRNPVWIGYYEIPVLPGSYTVQIEAINQEFTGGSSVGVLDPPLYFPYPLEFWNLGESSTDLTSASDPISVTAGQTVENIDIILNGTPNTFDRFEDPEVSSLEVPPQEHVRPEIAEGRNQ